MDNEVLQATGNERWTLRLLQRALLLQLEERIEEIRDHGTGIHQEEQRARQTYQFAREESATVTSEHSAQSRTGKETQHQRSRLLRSDGSRRRSEINTHPHAIRVFISIRGVAGKNELEPRLI